MNNTNTQTDASAAMRGQYWSSEAVLSGIKEMPSSSRRIGGKLRARFIVICDGERDECATIKSLDRVLGCISTRHKPEVFKNWDNGITIKF